MEMVVTDSMNEINCFSYEEIHELFENKFVVCRVLERIEGRINLLGVVDVFESKQPALDLLEILECKDGGDYIMIPTFEDYELLYELDVESFTPTPLLDAQNVSDFLKRFYGWG
jgi:hypothetical protein